MCVCVCEMMSPSCCCVRAMFFAKNRRDSMAGRNLLALLLLLLLRGSSSEWDDGWYRGGLVEALESRDYVWTRLLIYAYCFLSRKVSRGKS